MTFGQEVTWGASREESRRILDAYVDAGGNFIDTAINYTQGTSEAMLGQFLAGNRDRFVLATKYTMNNPTGDPNIAGNHRKNLARSLESSLTRLRTSYVDLYWVHAWDAITPVEETMRALDDMVRAGKVLYVGISNAPAWVISRANMLAELRGWSAFVGVQVAYSLLERTAERELLPMARALNLAATAWSPLGGGLLSGKYNRPADGAARRLDQSTAVAVDDRNLAIAAVVQQVAAELGRSPSQVALAWVRQQGLIPILGARSPRQMEDNLASLDLTLEPAHRQRLDEASAIDPGYPHDFLARPNVRASVTGGFTDLTASRSA
jgi:aryl-alcohol dehydrogenase-like predicted oxidoreductase